MKIGHINMDWKTDLSKSALATMHLLGNYGPTSNPNYCEIKGYLYDDEGGYKSYLTAKELISMSEDLIEVANWLNKRREEANDPSN